MASLTSKRAMDILYGESGTFYASLNADDPGPDGQGVSGNNEFTGSGYGRAPIAEGDWAATIDSGDYRIKKNGAEITFPQATGDWAGGTNAATWIAIWDHPTSQTEDHFIERLPINNPSVVVSGDVPYFPIGDIQIARKGA